ncbi:MAG TPA: class I SAM-dependent methyltransferase, partial [Myxococcaceae bacterium]|nr:class I SAM-dependent methyltransferase [Myxococcaceae bacterium]
MALPPSDFDARDIYTAQYFDGSQPDGYANYADSEAVLRSEFRKTVTYLVEAGARPGRLLEVGSAYGFFLAEAAAHFQSTGVELCREAAEFAQRRGLDVRVGPVDEVLTERQEPFSVAVMLDVIEHLPDPAAAVRAVGDRLAPEGLLLITTGDWGSLFA